MQQRIHPLIRRQRVVRGSCTMSQNHGIISSNRHIILCFLLGMQRGTLGRIEQQDSSSRHRRVIHQRSSGSTASILIATLPLIESVITVIMSTSTRRGVRAVSSTFRTHTEAGRSPSGKNTGTESLRRSSTWIVMQHRRKDSRPKTREKRNTLRTCRKRRTCSARHTMLLPPLNPHLIPHRIRRTIH